MARYRRVGFECRRGKLEYPPVGRITASIDVPTEGALAVGLGSVWAIDRENAERGADGTPKGSLYRVDPATNLVNDRIPGILGGSVAFADGDVWIASPALNSVLRVDPATHSIARISTGPLADEYPAALVTTQRGVWVGNHHGGDIVRIDPRTNRAATNVTWFGATTGGPQRLATDGRYVWAISARANAVLQIDADTDREVGRIGTAQTGTCGGMTVGARAIWITSGYDLPYTCWRRPHWGLFRIDRTSGRLNHYDVGGERPFDVREAFGALWVLTDYPHTDLFRLDPTTGRVTGRLRLAGYPNSTDALATGFGSLWVRLAVSGLDVVPSTGYVIYTPPVTGTLLRIEPTR